jgi:Sigma 54 modulation protein / S30EA ribosomal protein
MTRPEHPAEGSYCEEDEIMMIQVNSDKGVVVDRELSFFVKAELRRSLGKLAGRLTRIEVHLSDLGSHNPGPPEKDKRCLLEARPAGKKPVSVSDKAATIEQAVQDAAGKLQRRLETQFGRARDRHSRRAA